MKTIDMSEFQAKLKEEQLNLVDVRAAAAYREGHLSGAINLPLEELPARLTELDKTKTYYLICQRGIKSAEAVDFLTAKGYDAINVQGGMAAAQE